MNIFHQGNSRSSKTSGTADQLRYPEMGMWEAKLKPQSTACSVSPMLLTRPLIIINQMAKSVSN
jgi:hypothetical protein